MPMPNMPSPTIVSAPTTPIEWTRSQASSSASSHSSGSDAAKFAGMGYGQGMKRKFSVWSLLGVGFSLTNSWFGISTGLVTGINSGGPVLIVYGIILVTVISTCVGISLSELASAFPNAGGQYFWASELAPQGYGKFAGYLTGWFAWAGSIFTSASVALGLGSAIMGCIQLLQPDITIRPWMIVSAYELINIFSFFFNCYGRFLPHITTLTLAISLLSFTTIVITVPATATTHSSPNFVFAHFENNTGWPSNSIAFIVGLINTNWAFACLDCATHLAEEVARPEKMIPIAIMGTIAIGFVTSWFYSVAMFFSMNDLPALFHTPTKVPILELFHQALRSRRGAVVLECLIILTGLGCLIASHTWQSRLCWSFARDWGIPGSGWLSRIHPTLDVPLNAHLASCLIVAMLGLLYLGSDTAFHSLVTACIVLLYISYSIPIVCLLIGGRENVRHGPFWLGKTGMVANFVLLAWTIFTLVMYCFPPVMPVNARNMNYVCVVYAIVLCVALLYWRVRGGKTYRNREERYGEISGVEEPDP